jgi:hypothetical protein
MIAYDGRLLLQQAGSLPEQEANEQSPQQLQGKRARFGDPSEKLCLAALQSVGSCTQQFFST